MNPKQLVLIGGGSSIKEGISQRLWSKIRNNFVIGLNYSFNHFISTLQTFVDKDFYEHQYEQLKKLPLIIGKENKYSKPLLGNTITLKASSNYNGRNIKNGIYKSYLVGLFSLSLGIFLLDEGTIFIIGFDGGKISTEKDQNNKFLTHYYQGEIKHRGIGELAHYNNKRLDKDFGVYQKETKIKIYNVSLKSNISVFPKISYEDFFKKLDNRKYNQDKLREEIKNKIKEGIR